LYKTTTNDTRNELMNLHIPDIRVGEPTSCGRAAVFPLFAGRPSSPDGTGSCDYALASEAMAAGTVAVSEVSEAGQVPYLLVANCGDLPVFFLEGEEVRGGRQNRVLCGSVLAAAGSRTHIPVVCTQRKRWEQGSRPFAAGSCCPPSLRHLLKGCNGGRQSHIWATIRQNHFRLGVRSPSENLSDALETHRGRVEDLRQHLPYVEGASGVAVALGGKVACIDLFDGAATLEKLWDRLIEGLALDAVEAPDTARWLREADISVELYKVRIARWQQVETVGLGEAYRATGEAIATALVVDDVPIHVSVSMQC
jgi:hypothetical protein